MKNIVYSFPVTHKEKEKDKEKGKPEKKGMELFLLWFLLIGLSPFDRFFFVSELR